MDLGKKKETVTRYISQGLRSRRAFQIAGIPTYQYYFRPQKGKPGRKPGTPVLKIDDKGKYEVMNQEVVKEIEDTQADPGLNYGDHVMTRPLQLQGWQINHKKIYRLLREM